LKRLVGESQHHDRHAEIEDDRPGIDYATGKGAHLFDRGKITEQLLRLRADIAENKRDQPRKKSRVIAAKEIIAATIWFFVRTEAKQPIER
jgi:hypothetical protein